jgi:hypothetical protein
MVEIFQYLEHKRNLSIILLLIPLGLSAFTHIWNPVGFPTLHVDESHYMRRAMQVMEGLGPQESEATYDYGYDHPYFGQIFLGAVLSLVNYPFSINPTVSAHSIEMLYLVPRVLMGILAVVDTFLVYKIADAKYNRKVAFVSSTLFAVMPLGSILRGIFLDSIALPLILLSILFAIYSVKSEARYNRGNDNNKRILLILLSGIFLGLAIFTKMPVFTMIPLLAYILLKSNDVQTSNNEDNTVKKKSGRLKLLAIWFVPVVLIPLMWPVLSITAGQFDGWLQGVVYQTARDSGGKNLRSSILYIFETDPLLLIFGAVALIYSVIKKDYFILLWSFPYLIFLYAIGWVVPFHWSILVPALCISLGAMIVTLVNLVRKSKTPINYAPQIIISVVIVLGLIGSSTLIMTNLNTSYFDLYSFIVSELTHNSHDNKSNQSNSDATTMIGSHRTRALMWIPLYVFQDNVTFRETDIPNDNFTEPVRTKKFLLVADTNLLSRLTSTDQYYRDKRVTDLYYNTSATIATFIDKQYKRLHFMTIEGNYGFGVFVDVRANY